MRKAVLDIEDENLSMKGRWEKNRLNKEEAESLKKAFLSLWKEDT